MYMYTMYCVTGGGGFFGSLEDGQIVCGSECGEERPVPILPHCVIMFLVGLPLWVVPGKLKIIILSWILSEFS